MKIMFKRLTAIFLIVSSLLLMLSSCEGKQNETITTTKKQETSALSTTKNVTTANDSEINNKPKDMFSVGVNRHAFQMVGDDIYFSTIGLGNIISENKQNKECKRLGQPLYYNAYDSDLFVVDDWIYYLRSIDGAGTYIEKISLKDLYTYKVVVEEDSSILYFMVADNKIYYYCTSEKEGKIYSCNLDGSDKKLLVNGEFMTINWMIYYEEKLYVDKKIIDVNNPKKVDVFSEYYLFGFWNNNMIYYNDDDKSIYKRNLSTNKDTMLFPFEDMLSVFLVGDKLCYYDSITKNLDKENPKTFVDIDLQYGIYDLNTDKNKIVFSNVESRFKSKSILDTYPADMYLDENYLYVMYRDLPTRIALNESIPMKEREEVLIPNDTSFERYKWKKFKDTGDYIIEGQSKYAFEPTASFRRSMYRR